MRFKTFCAESKLRGHCALRVLPRITKTVAAFYHQTFLPLPFPGECKKLTRDIIIFRVYYCQDVCWTHYRRMLLCR